MKRHSFCLVSVSLLLATVGCQGHRNKKGIEFSFRNINNLKAMPLSDIRQEVMLVLSHPEGRKSFCSSNGKLVPKLNWIHISNGALWEAIYGRKSYSVQSSEEAINAFRAICIAMASISFAETSVPEDSLSSTRPFVAIGLGVFRTREHLLKYSPKSEWLPKLNTIINLINEYLRYGNEVDKSKYESSMEKIVSHLK